MNEMQQAKQLAAAIVAMKTSATDQQALAALALYPTYEDLVARQYVAENTGYRFQFGGGLWKTLQPGYTFDGVYAPGTGTESLYARIDESHAGTLEDPIPYEGNMELFSGKYYSQDGVVYRCTRDSGQPLYHKLSELVGLYVEVAA